MRASVRLGWRVAAVVAFAATAALAVILTRGAPMHAALTSARHTTKGHSASGVPQCATFRLRISLGAGPSTGVSATRAAVLAGVSPRPADHTGTGYRLEFTNISGAACTLTGYPQVAAYRSDGAQVGNTAGWDTSVAARRILLAPGATAHTAVIASVSAGPCRPVVAAGLRVVPPGQSAARYVRHALAACSAAGPRAPVFLRVRAVQPGTGTARRQPQTSAASPDATTRTADSRSAASASLSTNPLAPARNPAYTYSSRSNVVRMRGLPRKAQTESAARIARFRPRGGRGE